MSKISRKRKYLRGTVARRPRLDVGAFRGEWVAIHPKSYKVIGHGPSLEEARQNTPNLGRLEPLLYYVPKSDAFFIGRTT